MVLWWRSASVLLRHPLPPCFTFLVPPPAPSLLFSLPSLRVFLRGPRYQQANCHLVLDKTRCAARGLLPLWQHLTNMTWLA